MAASLGCGDGERTGGESRKDPQARAEISARAGGGVAIDALAPDELGRLSRDQTDTVREFGWPQGFAIYQVAGPGAVAQRVEEWRYHDAQQTYVFADGAFLHDRPAVDQPRGFRPTPHRPSLFASEMSVDEVRRIPGARELKSVRALGDSYRLITAPQLIAGFHDGRLTLIESGALVPQEGAR